MKKEMPNLDVSSCDFFSLPAEALKWELLNGGMKKLLKEGPPPPEPIESEALWEDAARVTLNLSRCNRAQRTAEYVSSLPEFSGFDRMLDMGAGPGIVGIAVTAAHETATCVVIDQPAVCKVADETIAEYGMEDRVTTECGDYMNDPIGTGYDFVMANYTLNFYRASLGEIMTKVYRALNPGGVFMVTSDGLNEAKTAPATMVLGWLSMSMQGMDMSFTRGEIADAMLRAGFVSTQSEMVDDVQLDPQGPIDIIIGRKGRS